MKQLWFDKYRPQTISDYIFADASQKATVEKFLAEKSIPHLCLYGHRGTGKTSLAYLFKKEFEIEDFDFLELNASKDNSVDVVRNRISAFVNTMAAGPFKIVFLDECDQMTPAAMNTLKKLMEEYSNNVRFIFACNKVSKLIPEIRSRCQEMHFQNLDKDEVTARAYTILRTEGIKVSLETLDKYVDAAYPDFRKLLNLLEGSVVNGEIPDSVKVKDTLFDLKAEAMLYVETGQWDQARKKLAENFADDDYEDLYRFFYDNLGNLDKFKDKQKAKAAIVLIAEFLYRNQFVADKEINFCALMIRLSDI